MTRNMLTRFRCERERDLLLRVNQAGSTAGIILRYDPLHAARKSFTEACDRVDPEVHKKILAAATRDKMSVSAWMTSAAREALQRRAGLAAVAEWEKQHGAFTAQEMEEAHRSVRAQLRTVRRSA